MEDYLVPSIQFSTVTSVLNSKFIGTISPVFSVDEAKKFVTQIKKKYPDANHNVPVYLVGHGSSVIAHSNDDGEPSGTAGRPALSVLKGSGLGDAAIVITRYFGGTKLGTGGLVKAYSNSARQVIKAVPKSIKTQVHHLHIKCHYRVYENIKFTLSQLQGSILDERFSGEVEIELSIPIENYPVFNARIIELTNGQVVPDVIRSNQVALVPYSGK